MHKLSFKAVFVPVVFVYVFEPGSPFKIAVSKQLMGFSTLLYFIAQAKLLCKPKFGLGRLIGNGERATPSTQKLLLNWFPTLLNIALLNTG